MAPHLCPCPQQTGPGRCAAAGTGRGGAGRGRVGPGGAGAQGTAEAAGIGFCSLRRAHGAPAAGGRGAGGVRCAKVGYGRGWAGRMRPSPVRPSPPPPGRALAGPNTNVGQLHLGGVDTSLAASLGPWVSTPLQTNRWRGSVQDRVKGVYVSHQPPSMPARACLQHAATSLWRAYGARRASATESARGQGPMAALHPGS